MVKESLKAFMSRLIDYAGLFPPANLSLKDAYYNYLDYISSDDEWMMGKFICPVKELDNVVKIMNTTRILKMSFSVLLTGGKDERNFNENLADDFIKLKKFYNSAGNIIRTDTFEIKIPVEFSDKSNFKKLAKFIEEINNKIADRQKNDFKVFYEYILNDDWKEQFNYLNEAIANANLKLNCSGFKLRTGGVTADAFPPPEVLSTAIHNCFEYKVPLKATAGLHHPIRHFNNGVNSMMHGFINFFGAGILNCKNNLPPEVLTEIINETNPTEFIFSDEELYWKGFSASVEEIKNARNNFMLSYGSCSFDEPREDLKNLNLL